MEDKKVFVPVKYINVEAIEFQDVSVEILDFLDTISNVEYISYLEKKYTPVIIFDRPDKNTKDLLSYGLLEERSLLELTTHISVEFAKWIADFKLHGSIEQLYNAMIIYDCKTVEELFQFFINNVYKLE